IILENKMLMIEDTLSREKTFDNTDETDENSFMDESLIRLPRFKKAIYSAIGSKSYFALENLMSAYFNDLAEQVIVCYSRPMSASKFGNHINRALTLFHFYWVDIKEQIDDNSSYLNKMTDILEKPKDNKIDELAIKILGIHPPNESSDVFKFLPCVPSFALNNKTLWWMQQDSFDEKKSFNDLIMYKASMDKTESPLISSLSSTSFSSSCFALDSADPLGFGYAKMLNINKNVNCTMNEIGQKKIIHVDLTVEEDMVNEKNNSNKNNNGKFTRRQRLLWLKRVMDKEQINNTCNNHLKFVDATCTKNYDYGAADTTNTIINMPISSNKISESSESSTCKMDRSESFIRKDIPLQLIDEYSTNFPDIDASETNISNTNRFNLGLVSPTNLDICPVSTTVLSEDISNHEILWDDLNLLKSTNYELDFDTQSENNKCDAIENVKKTLLNVGNTSNNENGKNFLKAEHSSKILNEDSINEYENIAILDSILYGDMSMPADQRILDVSPPIKQAPANWSELFDYHLANIESPEDTILSSVHFVDPRLTRTKRVGGGPFYKNNYMSCLGLSQIKNISTLNNTKTPLINKSSIDVDMTINSSPGQADYHLDSTVDQGGNSIIGQLSTNVRIDTNNTLLNDNSRDNIAVECWNETSVNSNTKTSINANCLSHSNVSSTTSHCNTIHEFEEPPMKKTKKSPRKIFQHRRSQYNFEDPSVKLHLLKITGIILCCPPNDLTKSYSLNHNFL
ncbi:hypothetical protein PV326_004333, partial [Microctonus aethiopoides]